MKRAALSLYAILAVAAVVLSVLAWAPRASATNTYSGWVTWSTSLAPGVTTPQNAGDVTWPQHYVGKGIIDAPCGAVYQRDLYANLPESQLADWIANGLPGDSSGGADAPWIVGTQWSFSVGDECETSPTPTPTPEPTPTDEPTVPLPTTTLTPAPETPTPDGTPSTDTSGPVSEPSGVGTPLVVEVRTKYAETCTTTTVIHQTKTNGGPWVTDSQEVKEHADNCHSEVAPAGVPVIVSEGE